MFRQLLRQARGLQRRGWQKNTIMVYLEGYYEGWCAGKEVRE